MTRNESPTKILKSIAWRTLGGLLLIPGIPLAIVGMVVFEVVDGVWKWVVGRRK